MRPSDATCPSCGLVPDPCECAPLELVVETAFAADGVHRAISRALVEATPEHWERATLEVDLVTVRAGVRSPDGHPDRVSLTPALQEGLRTLFAIRAGLGQPRKLVYQVEEEGGRWHCSVDLEHDDAPSDVPPPSSSAPPRPSTPGRGPASVPAPRWPDRSTPPEGVARLPFLERGRVEALCADAELQLSRGELRAAAASLHEVLAELPGEVFQWYEAGWVFAALGELERASGKHDHAMRNLRNAGRCRGWQAEPLLSLRLGQSLLALGDREAASEHLATALARGGRELFRREAPELLAHVEAQLGARVAP